ncbi:MAG: NAD-dependent deacylase [Chloroflexota bacterium]
MIQNSTNFQKEIERAAELLSNCTFAVALTGAGISTPSGIPDFRSPASGLWEKHNPMEVANIGAFRRRPEDFYDWIRPLVKITSEAKPNPAHLALARLEQGGPLQGIITQNIDGLHTDAGSKSVYEVHGHTRELECLSCSHEEPAQSHMTKLAATGDIPYCSKCRQVMKPKVILFGELLPWQIMADAEYAAAQAEVMIVAGSSLEVAPVSELPRRSHQNGTKLIIINYQPTHVDHLADVVIREDVAKALPAIYTEFKKKQTNS